VPFRVPDDAVIVEAPPGRVRRLLRRPSDRYSPWRRGLLHINRAVALEIHTHSRGEDVGPCDFLEVDFDPEDSTVDIYGDSSPAIVSVCVESIDVVVEETSKRVGWRQEDARVSGVVLPAPPPGSRPIPTRFVVFVCRTCGAWNLGPEEIVHLRTRCEGRSDLSHIDAVTAQAVKRETL
jgi:hypothetical protein